MDPETILHELTFAEALPREALAAAAARREEMVPFFLQEIDSFLATPPEERGEPSPLFLIFHLLGEWREKRAYRPLARLLRGAGDDIEWILGDGTTETSHRVMASVYDGDLRPLIEIIVDAGADEYIRARMFAALAMLTLWERADRDEVVQFLRDCFAKLQPQGDCFVWDGWQTAIVMLDLHDLVPLVKQACERGFIDPSSTTLEEFEEDLASGDMAPRTAFQGGKHEYTLFGDTATELEGYGFYDWSAAGDDDDLDPEDELALAGLWQEPAVNPFKDVGRNDPCPCGSGKKFKKCCLQ